MAPVALANSRKPCDGLPGLGLASDEAGSAVTSPKAMRTTHSRLLLRQKECIASSLRKKISAHGPMPQSCGTGPRSDLSSS